MSTEFVDGDLDDSEFEAQLEDRLTEVEGFDSASDSPIRGQS